MTSAGIHEECIEWDGARTSAGYANAWDKRRKRTELVHRLVWEEERGPIPPGAFVCHRCDNKPCINIDHLFLGTPLDNMRDMIGKGRAKGNGFKEKTHCKRGHLFDAANTYWLTRGRGRACRECARLSSEKYEAEKRRR
jgi:hypothetical protein